MTGAVEARDDLIVLITNTGSQIVIADTPCLGWLTAPSTAPVPVITDTLTPIWAHCVITPHPASSPELIGGLPQIAVFVPDTWRGSFGQFLTWLETSTGLAIVGTELMSDPLKGAFWAWVSDRHGGEPPNEEDAL
jgi:hypothetical protein